MRPSISISIKSIEEDSAKEVAHIVITPGKVNPDNGEYGNYKYLVQEPGGGIQEGEIEGFHEGRGILTLLGLVISDAGHYGQLVHVRSEDIANMIGHEKMEEIQDNLKRMGD